MAKAGIVWTIRPTAQIGRTLNRAAHQAPEAFGALAETHAARGEQRAKATTLYQDQTGTLRGGTYGRAEGTDIYIGATAAYTVYVHEGTRYLSARRFLVEAANETAPEYVTDAGALAMRVLGGRG